MARPVSTQPTEVELQILRILWQHDGATAREIHNLLAEVEERDRTYSTTVKMLSVMLDKGLVRRDEAASPQIYRAASSRKITQRKMLRDLIEKVYDGSALSLVMQALSSTRATPEELAEIRKMVAQLEEQRR
ncbi:MAG TPA: BlaI/MecI/CopY family transcriptional regulator [Pirellulales bacterium]|nr:BlaI/MecI/CopY family transcriptional regulator [Pirellulales bacterium]